MPISTHRHPQAPIGVAAARIMALCLILAVSPGPVLAFSTPQARAPTTVVVPEVTGRTAPEARRLLASLRMDPVTVRDTVVSGLDSGTVVRQLPPAGFRATLPTGATLWVSRPLRILDAVRRPLVESFRTPTEMTQVRPTVTVPDVRKLLLAEARGILKEVGLASSVETVPSGGAPGVVLRQLPEPGTAVQPGALARLWVADQAAAPTVPRVIGQPLEMARRIFLEAKIPVTRVEELSVDPAAVRSPPAEGSVVRQLPAADTPLEPGVGGTLWVVTYDTQEPDEVETPDVVGMELDPAVRRMEAVGLEVERVVTVTSDAPEGTVVVQRPGRGTLVPPGSGVALAVAQGPAARIAMPDLVGGTLADGEAELAAARLRIAGVSREPSQAPVGTVVRQSPPPGTEVEPGSPVDLAVSEGTGVPEAVAVPAVVGLEMEGARGALEEAGFALGPVDGVSSDAPAGSVVDQWPPGGALAVAGTEVRIRVSSGTGAEPVSVPVPEVVGMVRAAAAAELATAGLQAVGADDPGARVAEQFPAAGTAVPPGTPVLLTLQAQAPAPLTWLRGWAVWGLPVGIAALLVLLRIRRLGRSRKDGGEDEPDTEEASADAPVEYRLARRSPRGSVEVEGPLLPSLEVGLRPRPPRAPLVTLNTLGPGPLAPEPSDDPDRSPSP